MGKMCLCDVSMAMKQRNFVAFRASFCLWCAVMCQFLICCFSLPYIAIIYVVTGECV
jgi:hypothetical protein